MARKRKGRAVHGVLLLDKPQVLTSNGALQRVRRLYQAQKAGHTGALDPLATGVLPICLGEATKFSRFLLESDKAYHTTAQLGEIRDSGDSDGAVVEQRDVPVLDVDAVEAVLARFRGDIQQVPSMYSALKHEGRPLYEWARKGITIDRPARPVSIHLLQLDALRTTQLDLSVECSKGTYIRSLVEDIGGVLGCGAHVCMLRRYRAGHFSLADCHSLDSLEAKRPVESERAQGDYAPLDALLLAVDELLPDLPQIWLNNEQSRSLLHGQAVRMSGLETTGLARAYVTGMPQAAIMADQLGAIDTGHEQAVFAGVVDIRADGEVVPMRLISFPEAPAAE